MNEAQNQPAYKIAEAARYVRLPAATLRSWMFGRKYPKAEGTGRFHPLLKPALVQPPLLSFSNLIEAHVLRALRSEHGVSVQAVRASIEYAERQLKISRLLLRPELRTGAGRVFLERYGKLIELSASGQLAMREVFNRHLARIEWNSSDIPIRLFPFVSASSPADDRPIVIDPQIAFGRPVILSKGVSTSAIVERIDADESVEEVAADYDLDVRDVTQALVYERAA